MYQGFGQAELGFGGLILGLSQFQVMTELPQKLLLTLKGVKRSQKWLKKIIKTLIHTVVFVD